MQNMANLIFNYFLEYIT